MLDKKAYSTIDYDTTVIYSTSQRTDRYINEA